MQSLVDISDAEYEQRRHAADLALWVNAKFRQIEAGGRLEEQFFERRGRNVKRLIEEAVPLSRLGLYLWTPGNEPYVTLFPASTNVDGNVEVQGFAARSFDVEITTVESDESAMRRQALSRKGIVPFFGPITRKGREIIARGEMVDVVEQSARVVQMALERLRRKAESGRYDAETAFLVYLSDPWTLPIEGKLDLRAQTLRYLMATAARTCKVFYCFAPEYTIEAVEVHRTESPSG